ncbi:MAG TPA: IPTL-CTERM sorting domain-containing protein [Casimicrobiaceae bacterium]|nr:IPTL-CTERM sorting domain-containing protein [Casimicrobiaceae bacterium]
MPTNPHLERMLQRVDPSRRDAVRKILAGAAIYSAPLIASYSMDTLDGVAQAQSGNQTRRVGIPATSGWSLIALAGALGATGAFLLRRKRAK